MTRINMFGVVVVCVSGGSRAPVRVWFEVVGCFWVIIKQLQLLNVFALPRTSFSPRQRCSRAHRDRADVTRLLKRLRFEFPSIKI